MRLISLALLTFFLLFPLAHAKPSYSFGDEPRHCKSNSDCAIIIVSCHKCDWADSVNKTELASSEKTVKSYCENWSRQSDREKDCEKTPAIKKREAICSNGLCEARTFYAPDSRK